MPNKLSLLPAVVGSPRFLRDGGDALLRLLHFDQHSDQQYFDEHFHEHEHHDPQLRLAAVRLRLSIVRQHLLLGAPVEQLLGQRYSVRLRDVRPPVSLLSL